MMLAAFFKLIRWKNLVLIAFAQFLMRYAVIQPMIKANDQSLELPLKTPEFILIVLATVFIAAAGYIINDYFDIRIDSINKPDGNIIGKQIRRQWAIGLHLALNGLGFIMGLYVSYKVGLKQMGFVFLLAAGALWFYSTNFKKQLIVGNVLISLLIGMVPMLIGLFEIPLLNFKYQWLTNQQSLNFNSIAYFVVGFSVFAFIGNLIREIIKDVEDQEGDRRHGAETLPIVYGNKITKIVLLAIMLIEMSALAWLQYNQWLASDTLSFIYFSLFIQLPLLLLMYLTIKAETKQAFKKLSALSKLSLFLGLCYALVIYFSLSSIPK